MYSFALNQASTLVSDNCFTQILQSLSELYRYSQESNHQMITDFEWKKAFSIILYLGEENIVAQKEYYFTEIFFFFFWYWQVCQYSSIVKSLNQWYEHFSEGYECGHNKENNLLQCHMKHKEENLLDFIFFQVFR